jgi:hypothetical protein
MNVQIDIRPFGKVAGEIWEKRESPCSVFGLPASIASDVKRCSNEQSQVEIKGVCLLLMVKPCE